MADKIADSRSIAWYDAGRFGRGCVVCSGNAVERVWLPVEADKEHKLRSGLQEHLKKVRANSTDGGFAAKVAKRLERLFTKGEDVSDIEIVSPPGGPFIEKAWAECRRIQRGATLSYTQLANKAGNVKAVRAAGNAMAKNPLPLLVPCHRVLSADGRLANYGGGLAMKQHLLEVEGAAFKP